MSGIRSKNTKPELLIRKSLHSLGFRYVLHDQRLPGRPDLVFPRYRAVVFVHGCFWHGHRCALFKVPQTRPDFWQKKLDRNRSNDIKHRQTLIAGGWRVATVWECALRKGPTGIDAIAGLLAEWLKGSRAEIEVSR